MVMKKYADGNDIIYEFHKFDNDTVKENTFKIEVDGSKYELTRSQAIKLRDKLNSILK